jgi:hypothetical protein
MQRGDELGGAPELHVVLQGATAVPTHPQGLIGGEAADAHTRLRHLVAEELQATAAVLAAHDRRDDAVGGIGLEGAGGIGVGGQIRSCGRGRQPSGVGGWLVLQGRGGQAAIEERQPVFTGLAALRHRPGLKHQSAVWAEGIGRPWRRGSSSSPRGGICRTRPGHRGRSSQGDSGARPDDPIGLQQQTPLDIAHRLGRDRTEIAIGGAAVESQADQLALQRLDRGAAGALEKGRHGGAARFDSGFSGGGRGSQGRA